jgi:uncharacterized protein involved in type VI secretion and phage assembly
MSLTDLQPNETSHESGGYVKGVAIGIVTQNQDPDGLCRVKVRFPWHEQPRESYWARLAMPMAGNNRGYVTIPEVDDEVLVAFEREDLRFPYILGALWNGKDKPPVANDDGKNDRRIWQSRSGSHLLFVDASASSVKLMRDDGTQLLFDQNGILLKDPNGNFLEIKASGAVTLNATGPLKLKGSTVAIEADSTGEVKAGATLKLTGSLIQLN